ncbi:PRC-barrel domain-containing protein [Bradyrhizobium sp. WSM3983]|uniref:PRC-barrel domain-containing protein n=1 Tax=Bradyrhizobium sp. WSM3983 TaxID=1038867 RepID=UPI0004224FA0|nr:PRC-barrel domain-containing protein [Bradyrhizobium sp. WSM3983]
MIRSRFSWPSQAVVVLTIAALAPWMNRAAAQEVGLTPLETNEVARGYRAESLKLKPVVNDKSETIGRISDFIFGKDGNIYAVLAVGDFTGLGGQLVAIPYRSLKLDESSSHIVLPGASRNALQKLPVFVSSR